MFVSKRKMLLSKIVAVLLLILSAPWAFLSIVGLGLSISRLFGSASAGEDLSVAIGILLFFGLLVVWAVVLFRRISAATRFNTFFELDADGILPVEQLAASFGKPADAVAKSFQMLLKHGYLVNCVMQNPDALQIVLYRNGNNIKERMDVCCCPSCGASVTVRHGFVAVCPYCHSDISSSK